MDLGGYALRGASAISRMYRLAHDLDRQIRNLIAHVEQTPPPSGVRPRHTCGKCGDRVADLYPDGPRRVCGACVPDPLPDGDELNREERTI
jgi:hypothetical protein